MAAQPAPSLLGLGSEALVELRDGNAALLFCTRAVRMIAYGICGVVLALYLSTVGLPDQQIGMLMTGTLVGDAAISLVISMYADKFGRRRMLLIGCLLKVLGAAVFAYVSGPDFWLLLFGATIGVISPSGNEVGPFMALEQSMLSDLIKPVNRTSLFAWYNLVGYVSTALGALMTGYLTTLLMQKFNLTELDSYRAAFAEYGALAMFLFCMTLLLSNAVETLAWRTESDQKRAAQRARDPERDPGAAEPLLQSDGQDTEGNDATTALSHLPGAKPEPAKATGFFGLSRKSQAIVFKLSALFSMDSFGGGIVTGSLIVYYFKVRFGVGNEYLGGLMAVANVIAGISSLLAGWVASKVGLVNTMVVTHLPSNILLMLIPVMPNLQSATAMLFLRYSISQMDVAPRQSYVSGIVPAHERTVTIGITNIVRSMGAALGPTVTGYLAANNRFDWAFYLAGGVKALYDLLLLWSFQAHKADHERS